MEQIQEYLAGSVIASLLVMSIFALIVAVFVGTVAQIGMELWDLMFGEEEDDEWN